MRRLLEVGSRDIQGLPLLAQPALRQSYAPMAGNPRPPAMSPPTPSRRDLRAERQARREGAHALEKPEPLYAKHGGTHVRWTCRNTQKLNKTQGPNVQRQRPINTTNAVNATRVQPQCSINATNTLNATKQPARTPHKGYKPCERHKRPTKTLHKQHKRCKRHKTFVPSQWSMLNQWKET